MNNKMKSEPLVYWLVYNANFLDDHPEYICSKKVTSTEFDSSLLSFGRGSLLPIWPNDVEIFITGNQPVDYLLSDVHIDLVSDRVKMIFEEKANDDIELLPVNVMYDDGKPYDKMKYWAINILTIVDALDWENTRWSTPKPPNRNDPLVYMNIIKPSIYAMKIGDANIFRLEVAGKIKAQKFVSLKIKKELERLGFTVGMQFTPIKTN